jgi:hypothetical protein
VSHLQRRNKINMLKILEAFKTSSSMHIRGLARATNIHPATVSSIVSRLGHFFDIEVVEVVPGFNAKIVRLKNPNTTIEDVERYIKVKKQIKGVAESE